MFAVLAASHASRNPSANGREEDRPIGCASRYRLKEGRPLTHDIVPLTSNLWPAFEELLASRAPATAAGVPISGCRRRRDRHCNRDQIKARIEEDPPLRLLAIDDGVADGPMQISPSRRCRRYAGQSDLLFLRGDQCAGRGLRAGWSPAMSSMHTAAARAGWRPARSICRDSRSLGLLVGSSRVFERSRRASPAGR